MLNYLKKFAMDILPSVAATIIGAYIVNHYIVAKPSADAPSAKASVQAKKAEPNSKAKPAEPEVASIPQPGVKARGISERALIEKLAAERPAEVKPAKAEATAKSAETKSAETKSAEKKSVETASLPEAQRHPPASREKEKAVAKAPAEAATPPGEDRAAELAREAIERLRAKDAATHVEEAARAPEPPHLQDAPHVVAAAPVRPLPPPINVATPQAGTAYGTPYAPAGNSQGGPGAQIPGQGSSPSSTASIANNDPDRPIPPADIPQPTPPSIDLQKGANDAVARTTTVAHDMLSAAKSMFQAVLPGGQKLSDPANQNFTD